MTFNPMRKHTQKEIASGAERLEQWAGTIAPATIDWEDTPDLAAIAQAADAVRDDESRLRKAVELARANGRSWNRIAVALGVSRQAARQRFVEKTGAGR